METLVEPMTHIGGSVKEIALQKTGWKIEQNSDGVCKARYVGDDDTVEIVKETDDEQSYSGWGNLPNILLEEIFAALNVRDRYNASMVCHQWFIAFYLPQVWNNFLFDDRTLTRPKYNYHSGWQYCLDHARTQTCISKIGKFLRGLEFRPVHNFNNIYQFMTMLSWSIDKGREVNGIPDLIGTGDRIKSLIYVFPCDMSQGHDPIGMKLFGTGGQLLKGLKDLLSKLTNLQTLKLIDFVLERFEANHLLDEVLDSCCTIMRSLNLVNVTTIHCPIMHVGLFIKLQVLTISPQNLSDDVLQLLADTQLKNLYILQNCYTSSYLTILPCSAKAWKCVKLNNPYLKVHIRVESMTDGEIVFQPEAPVYTLTYRTPRTRIQTDSLIRFLDNYKTTLNVYGYELLPKFTSAKSFDNRIDSLLLLMCRQCPNLTTLFIREKISTATVLLIAYSGRSLENLYLRRFAVIIRCDWPRHPEWSNDFYKWLKYSSRSYECVEREVSRILKKSWHFLSDAQYKQINNSFTN